MNTLFTEVKEEILRRAKAAKACTDGYRRAYKSEDFKELLTVVTDNIKFCCDHKVIDSPLLKKIGAKICNENNLYFSGPVSKGYALVNDGTTWALGNATVWVSGNAKVIASDNVTVIASDTATVEASDNTTIRAWDDAKVIAWDNAVVEAWNNATVWVSGNTKVIAWDNAKVKASGSATITALDNTKVIAWDNATVEALDNTTVRAWDNAYINSYNSFDHKLTGRAIVRYNRENRLVMASDLSDVKKLEH